MSSIFNLQMCIIYMKNCCSDPLYMPSVLRQPQTPWEPRVFPLDEDQEDALLSDDPEDVPLGRAGCSSASSTSKNSNSHRSPALSSGATLPSGGQSQSSTPNDS